MTVLAEIAKDPARAMFIVTRDPRIMPFADRIFASKTAKSSAINGAAQTSAPSVL